MHRSLGKILAIYVLGSCSLRFCGILSLMMKSDNPGEHILSLWLILGVVFFDLCLLLGKNTMVAVTRNGFMVLLLAGIYFAIVRLVTNYICTPIFGELVSGILTIAFILAPVLIYEMKSFNQ